ncbi:Rrf2 family transcriptional regulator [Streptosporangium sp. NPDC004379]|uniref:Rrf2 family transcriptional regulator n=1 Tax=Streptosporangium sp. NPDC004379 TaxID=3366189 RepID=UPI0036830B59
MSANSRMSVLVHVLTWMALDRRDNPEGATSQRIAGSVNTNPVVIRRCLGDLRKAGLVQARRGAGVGWSLTREPEAITLLDVYGAIEDETLFAMHHTPPNASCPVGFGIRPTLRRVYGRLDDVLRQELATTTIADVLRDVLAEQRSP